MKNGFVCKCMDCARKRKHRAREADYEIVYTALDNLLTRIHREYRDLAARDYEKAHDALDRLVSGEPT